MTPIRFFVNGVPAPKGSGRAIKGRAGVPVYLPGSSRKGQLKIAAFTKCVQWAATGAMRAQGRVAIPAESPIALSLVFWLRQPRSNKDGEPIRKPDLSKLVRCAEDGLTGIVYDDDARIVTLHARKRWVKVGQAEGVEIEVADARWSE